MRLKSGRLEQTAEPAEVGLSAGLLDRIPRLLREDVAAGLIPGAVVAVARGGRLAYQACVGFLDKSTGEPMRPEAIFRAYSMTKPLLTLATLSLVEEGRLGLHDPLSTYLPQFARLCVALDPRGARTVPAEREPTIFDLLLQTSGIGGGVYDSSATNAMYAERGLFKYEHTEAAYRDSLDDFVEALAELPLAFHPGTAWEYGRSSDVLGKVLEVATGQGLDEVLAERVFRPLSMQDTGFWVPPESSDLIAEPLRTPDARNPEGLIRVTRRPRFLSGGSGAFTTLDDYFRFVMMLLRRGELDGQRVVSARSVELMVSDHLGPLAGTDPDFMPGGGYGFGLGVAVRTHSNATTPGNIGDYYWFGRNTSMFFVDPTEELVGVLMMERHWLVRHFQRWFKTLVYQARLD